MFTYIFEQSFQVVTRNKNSEVIVQLNWNCYRNFYYVLSIFTRNSIGYKNGYNWLKSDITPQVHPINIPNCRFVRKQMLENTMIAVDKIQYCSEQVKRGQHILFVVKNVRLMFFSFCAYFLRMLFVQ